MVNVVDVTVDDDYLYMCGHDADDSDGAVKKYNKTTLAYIGRIIIASGGDDGVMGLCIDDNYIYFAYNANSVYGRRVAKYTKDLVFVAESTNLPSPNIYGHVFYKRE